MLFLCFLCSFRPYLHHYALSPLRMFFLQPFHHYALLFFFMHYHYAYFMHYLSPDTTKSSLSTEGKQLSTLPPSEGRQNCYLSPDTTKSEFPPPKGEPTAPDTTKSEFLPPKGAPTAIYPLTLRNPNSPPPKGEPTAIYPPTLRNPNFSLPRASQLLSIP